MSSSQPSVAGVIEALTGHRPADPALFIEALTHGSHGDRADYQRLEFLGDRVLGLIIADALYHRFPRESEGALAARLNGLVSRASCAEVARAIGIAPHMRLGKQARDDGGRESDNILGDVIEALIGALFLDAGLDAARSFVMKHWEEQIGATKSAPKHPKSALMEWAAAQRKKPPSYDVLHRAGPDHAPRFTVRASVPNAGEAEGEGTSKAEAEAAAAAALLARLETRS